MYIKSVQEVEGMGSFGGVPVFLTKLAFNNEGNSIFRIELISFDKI